MKKNKQTIEDVSFDIQIERKERSYAFGEARAGGRATMRALSTSAATDKISAAANIKKTAGRLESLSSGGNDGDIKQVISQYENAGPEDVLDQHGKITLDNYTIVTNGEADSVSYDDTKQWVNSKEYKEICKMHPKDKVELQNLNVSYTDDNTAAVNYSIKENDMTANCSAVVVKNGGAWKIAVYCQHPVA
jgi:hypothetical protein